MCIGRLSDVFTQIEDVMQKVRDFAFVDGGNVAAVGDGCQVILLFAFASELVFVVLFCFLFYHQVHLLLSMLSRLFPHDSQIVENFSFFTRLCSLPQEHLNLPS